MLTRGRLQSQDSRTLSETILGDVSPTAAMALSIQLGGLHSLWRLCVCTKFRNLDLKENGLDVLSKNKRLTWYACLNSTPQDFQLLLLVNHEQKASIKRS